MKRNVQRRNAFFPLWLLGALCAVVLVWCCNASLAWVGGPAPAKGVLATLVYLLFWLLFTAASRGDLRMKIAALIAALFHLLSSASAILAVSGVTIGWGGVFLTLFHAGTAFYGLRAWLNWAGVYAVGTTLSAAWALWCAVLLREERRPDG